MWARVKGKTENDLLGLPFQAAYMFRPASDCAAGRRTIEDQDLPRVLRDTGAVPAAFERALSQVCD